MRTIIDGIWEIMQIVGFVAIVRLSWVITGEVVSWWSDCLLPSIKRRLGQFLRH